jgi:hypothetical protein
VSLCESRIEENKKTIQEIKDNDRDKTLSHIEENIHHDGETLKKRGSGVMSEDRAEK